MLTDTPSGPGLCPVHNMSCKHSSDLQPVASLLGHGSQNTCFVCLFAVCRFEEGLHQANFIFTFLFTAEMILKIIGLGPWRYFTDAWSLFDAAVVAFSLVEVVTELMARSSAGGGMTALRCVDKYHDQARVADTLFS